MARPRKHDKHLPQRVHFKHGAYYYVKGGIWTRIGTDLNAALAEYARIMDAPKGGMSKLVDRVLTHIEPKLAKSTVEQYRIASRRVKDAFFEFAPHQVMPKHVAALKMDMADTPN